jgi:hypothetical protein
MSRWSEVLARLKRPASPTPVIVGGIIPAGTRRD